jgi:hypothetical protein
MNSNSLHSPLSIEHIQALTPFTNRSRHLPVALLKQDTIYYKDIQSNPDILNRNEPKPNTVLYLIITYKIVFKQHETCRHTKIIK